MYYYFKILKLIYINFKQINIVFRLTPEQMERLNNVSNPNEIPFPYKICATMGHVLGKSIEIPKKFQPIMNIKSSIV